MTSLYIPVPRPGAQLRVYGFPPSGAMGEGFYQQWPSLLPATMEWCAISLPGRGILSSQPSITDPRALTSSLVELLIAEGDSRPFVFFGHSVGAFLAYETARGLRRKRQPLPLFVALSGFPPPHLDTIANKLVPRMGVGFDGLADLVGPIPEELRRQPKAITAAFTPLLADLLLLLQNRHLDSPPLECELALYGGEDDPIASADDLDGWNDLFVTPAKPRAFPGRHLFPAERVEPLVAQFVRDLGMALI